MNNYYNRIMRKVPNSDMLVQNLSLSEHIPPYSQREFDMFLGYEYQTFIGLIYETALSLHDKYWDGYALTHCFLRNIKEFIKKFNDINQECLNDPKYMKINEIGGLYFKNIGTKTDGNVLMNLLYVPKIKNKSARFRIEAYEKIGVSDYPHILTSIDIYNDGRIENGKNVMVSKRPSGDIGISEIPNNIKPHIVFNKDGVQAVRDILAYVFENIKDKEEINSMHK